MNINPTTFSRFAWTLQLVVGSFLFLPSAVLAAGDHFSLGVASYEKGNYRQAGESLQKAVRQDPYNAVCHYYLANTLVYLADNKGAAGEYRACFDLDPFGQAGQFSRAALKKLGDGYLASIAYGPKNVLTDSGSSIRSSVASISRQTTEKGKFYQDNSQICARLASDSATVYANRVSQSADELVAEIQAANKGHMSEEIEADLQEIRQKALYKASWLREDAQQQAHRRMAAETKRSELVEKSAGNLLALISENPQVGKVKLKASGTNLYVRNYAMVPLPTPEPLRAEWKLLPQSQIKAARKGSLNL